jgi:hypothetical protein
MTRVTKVFICGLGRKAEGDLKPQTFELHYDAAKDEIVCGPTIEPLTFRQLPE